MEVLLHQILMILEEKHMYLCFPGWSESKKEQIYLLMTNMCLSVPPSLNYNFQFKVKLGALIDSTYNTVFTHLYHRLNEL